MQGKMDQDQWYATLSEKLKGNFFDDALSADEMERRKKVYGDPRVLTIIREYLSRFVGVVSLSSDPLIPLHTWGGTVSQDLPSLMESSDVEVGSGPSGIRTQDRRIKKSPPLDSFWQFWHYLRPRRAGCLEGEIQLYLIPNRDAICADL